MRRIALALFASILGVARCAGAEEPHYKVLASGAAVHFSGGDTCASITPGVAVERHVGRWVTVGGVYRNSNCARSLYLAECYMAWRLGLVTTGGCLGGVTGYRSAVSPAGGLAASYERLRLLYIPPVGGTGNVLWANVEVLSDPLK